MSTIKSKKLVKRIRGPIPLIVHIAKRMKLRQILSRYIDPHGNEKIYSVDTLLLLIYNLTIEKNPLYELREWCSTLDLPALGLNKSAKRFNDDRFGKALDKLYEVDRSSLMTELVVSVIKEFDINLNRIHNDSTSVKAFGKIGGKTCSGLQLKKGVSKDHRPDLKQLVFSLSISGDGAIPIHHKCYSGNRTDDTTHIETWNILRAIVGNPQFLYVGDSKLCTDKQLNYIVKNGGSAVTIIPETWLEVKHFKQTLGNGTKAKKVIWRRKKPGSLDENKMEYFSVFKGTYITEKRGFTIHWIYSSEKRKRDRNAREEQIKKMEDGLADINARINTQRLKTYAEIDCAVSEVLGKSDVKSCMWYEIESKIIEYRTQIGKGRPGKTTRYRKVKEVHFMLTWGRDRKVLAQKSRLDGIFPLLCTDKSISAKKVLQAYKYQPRLEKRFEQLKKIHHIAPLLFKKIQRVEANMFAFFIALIIQSLLEREVRKNMERNNIEGMYIYPEQRECKYPTSSIIFDRFFNVCRYEIIESNNVIERYYDELNKTQKDILDLIGFNYKDYWNNSLM